MKGFLPSFKRLVAPFESRSFSFLWLGQSVSIVGDQCYELALIWLLTDLTRSPLLIGLAQGIGYIPIIIFQVVAGGFIDKHANSAGRIMIGSDISRMLLLFIVAAVISLHLASLPVVMGAIVLYGLFQAFFSPAFSVLFVSLLTSNEFAQANALQQFSRQLMPLIGAALGGYLIAQFNVSTTFTFDGLTFAFSVLSVILLLRYEKKIIQEKKITRSEEKDRTSNIAKETKDAKEDKDDASSAFSFLMHNKEMLAMVLFFTGINLFNNVETVLMPILVRSFIHMTATQYSYLIISTSVGCIIAAVLFSLNSRSLAYGGIAICTCGLVAGIAFLFMGLATGVVILVIIYFIYGITFSISELINSTLRMHLVPVQMRGRVFSAITTLAMLLNPIGFFAAGLLGDIVGPRGGMWIGGGAIIAQSCLFLCIPAMRRLRFEDQNVPQKG